MENRYINEDDAPYQGIHIFKDNEHILTFNEDDAPVPDFNSKQRLRARVLVDYLNSPTASIAAGSFNPEFILDCFQHVHWPRPHERINI